jgi:hypothetical protein
MAIVVEHHMTAVRQSTTTQARGNAPTLYSTFQVVIIKDVVEPPQSVIWALFQTLKHTEGHHLNLKKFMHERAMRHDREINIGILFPNEKIKEIIK